MISTISPRGKQLAGAVSINFELLAEHAKTHPGEVLVIVDMIRRHVDNAFPRAPLTEEKTP